MAKKSKLQSKYFWAGLQAASLICPKYTWDRYLWHEKTSYQLSNTAHFEACGAKVATVGAFEWKPGRLHASLSFKFSWEQCTSDSCIHRFAVSLPMQWRGSLRPLGANKTICKIHDDSTKHWSRVHCNQSQVQVLQGSISVQWNLALILSWTMSV